jgi:hypothetical protein
MKIETVIMHCTYLVIGTMYGLLGTTVWHGIAGFAFAGLAFSVVFLNFIIFKK